MKTKEEIFNQIDYWTNWANNQKDPCYDIALLKVWIQFENFLSDIFIMYALGKESEEKYIPKLKIKFESEEQLNAILKDKNTYIDYLGKINTLSKHIFKNDMFSAVIMEDSNNNNVYKSVSCIRNYVAHESVESKNKYIKTCLGGGKFIDPSVYLKKKRKNSNDSNYGYYIKHIKSMIELLIDPSLISM